MYHRAALGKIVKTTSARLPYHGLAARRGLEKGRRGPAEKRSAGVKP